LMRFLIRCFYVRDFPFTVFFRSFLEGKRKDIFPPS